MKVTNPCMSSFEDWKLMFFLLGFHPKALNTEEKGRSPGFPEFTGLLTPILSGQWQLTWANYYPGIIRDGVTVAGTAPDFHRIPY